PAVRSCAEFIAQEVAGLGGPVGKGGCRELDAFAGYDVVVGDSWLRWVGAEQRVQHRRGKIRRSQLMHSARSEPAVMTGDDDGAAAAGVFETGSTVAAFGLLLSRPDPGPV